MVLERTETRRADPAGTSVVIVGGGFGGLAAACYLAKAGADVELVEKNDQLGGRASRLEMEGFRFDMGPSWYLMPDVFERFFGHFDRDVGEYYALDRLDPHYRIFFKDGDRVDITPDREQVIETFESYESGAGDALQEYLATSEQHYSIAMENFVYEDRPRLRDWVDRDVMNAAPVGFQLLNTMDEYVAGYFDHPKLQQIMQYTLVFLGGAPKNTPALYNMMSHVDFNMGVWYPEGGIAGVVDAIADIAVECGVTITLNTEIDEITRQRDRFRVESVDSEIFQPDVVVSDADYAHTEQALLPPQDRQYDAAYWNERTYAPSAFLMYLGVEGCVESLAHHTLVLPTDWDQHFEQIFDTPAWPDDPAYYLCAPSKTDGGVAPDGHSTLFVLVPIAPGLKDTTDVRTEYRDFVLGDIAENTDVDLHDRIVCEEIFCIEDFVSEYNSWNGTALGLAHTLRQTALFRPPHRSDAVNGLYFAGGYTTPGIGMPMCLISGEHAANAIIEDRLE